MKPLNRKNCIITVKPWSISNTQNQINYYKNKFNRFHVDIELDSYDDYNSLEIILQNVKNTNINMECFDFSVQLTKNLFSKKEVENLNMFESTLAKQNSTLFFKEFNTLWNIDEYNNAFNFINDTIKKIKDKNLSPLEQLLVAYKTVTDKIYNKEDKTDNALLSRTILGVSNSSHISCMGYSEWLKEICNGLNDKNIVCYSNSYKLYPKNLKDENNAVGHQFNVIYINDDKYNIKGFYCLDACWDSKARLDDIMGLSFFLIPFDDLKFYANYEVEPQPNNPFEYFISSEKPLIFSYSNGKVEKLLTNQSFVDLNELREKFKNTILKQYVLKDDENKLKDIQDRLSTTPFKGDYLEYTFLKYACNKIKQHSVVVNYEDIINALLQVCVKVDKMTVENAQEYIKSVVAKTKKVSFESFVKGAKNVFATIAFAEHNRRKTLQEQIEKRKQIVREKIKKQKKEKTKE